MCFAGRRREEMMRPQPTPRAPQTSHRRRPPPPLTAEQTSRGVLKPPPPAVENPAILFKVSARRDINKYVRLQNVLPQSPLEPRAS